MTPPRPAEKKAATRRYDSSSRRAAAQENRRRLASVARHLFAQQGYAATTINQIADEASLSPQTVYAAFGSKASVLEYLITSTLNVPSPPATQSWMTAATSAPTAAERIDHLVGGSTTILEQAGDLFAVLHQARYTDPDLTPLWDQGQNRRRDGISRVVVAMKHDGLLPTPVDPRLAIDSIWTFTSPEVFGLLILQRRWTLAQYRDWLGNVIAAELQITKA